MGLFEGKKGLILGVANDHSIAWAIAQQIMAEGGLCGFTHLPDRPDDERQRNRRRVALLTDPQPSAKFLIPMDAAKDDDIRAVMKKAGEEFGKIDFMLHSIAFASLDDLKRDTIGTSRDNFKMAMEISVYSLIAVAQAAQAILSPRASILTMTYFGGERTVPGYNIMGICKAALDASMRYLAYDLGPVGCRVNAITPARCGLWLAEARASRICCPCMKRWPRWAAISRTKKSGGPERFCCRTCPMESQARSSTSTAVITSWARRAGCCSR